MSFPQDCYTHFAVSSSSCIQVRGCAANKTFSSHLVWHHSQSQKESVLRAASERKWGIMNWGFKVLYSVHPFVWFLFTYYHDTCLCLYVAHTVYLLGLNLFFLPMSCPLPIVPNHLDFSPQSCLVPSSMKPPWTTPVLRFPFLALVGAFLCVYPFLADIHSYDIYLYEFPVAYEILSIKCKDLLLLSHDSSKAHCKSFTMWRHMNIFDQQIAHLGSVLIRHQGEQIKIILSSASFTARQI